MPIFQVERTRTDLTFFIIQHVLRQAPVKPKNPSKMPIIKVHQAQSSPRNGKDAALVVPIIGRARELGLTGKSP